jgi:hypothetical protein
MLCPAAELVLKRSAAFAGLFFRHYCKSLIKAGAVKVTWVNLLAFSFAALFVGGITPSYAQDKSQLRSVSMLTGQTEQTKQTRQTEQTVTEQEAYSIAREAYCYFYPLITMDITRKQCTNVEAGSKPGFGPMNQFTHMRAYPGADFKTVVRPNFDTLYSIAWLDMTEEPMIVSTADTNGRYYLLPMLDMWSDVFASPGWRTSGTTAKNFLVAPQSWNGKLPANTERIVASTPYTWVVGRTKTDGPADYPSVHKIQDGFVVTPLSQWGSKPATITSKIHSDWDMKTPPLEQVNKMDAATYFAYASELMKLHPPHVTDWSIVCRMNRIGIEPGTSFDASKLDPKIKQAIERGTTDELKSMVALLPSLGREANGWRMNTDTMGVYGDYYLKRAIVSMVGLGANQPEDAIYPMNFTDADGKPVDGNNNYVLHFSKEELPPVEAFWSITMYDKDGFQAGNSLNRFAISSWMPLKFNSDGSLDIYLQNGKPGSDKEANWLPAPKGVLGITMRLYAPKLPALTGAWNPPAIRLVK